MTAKLALGCGLALASAIALNWGYAAQHEGASRLPTLSLRHPWRSLALVFSHRRWLLGFMAGLAGWVLYVAALAVAPLSIVQAVSAAGIGVLALLVRATGVPLSEREWTGVALAMAALALLGISLSRGVHQGHAAGWRGVAAWVAVSALCAGLVASSGGRLLARGASLGVAAGVMYAAGDVATKAATRGGSYLLVFVPVLAACHGLAFIALQLGFQRGGVLATAGVATLFTNALPIAAGMTVFGEGMPGGLAGVLRGVAFAGALAAAVLLAARGVGAGETAVDASEARHLPLTD